MTTVTLLFCCVQFMHRLLAEVSGTWRVWRGALKTGAGVGREYLHIHICLWLRRLKENLKFVKNSCKGEESFGRGFLSVVNKECSPVSTGQEGIGFKVSTEI